MDDRVGTLTRVHLYSIAQNVQLPKNAPLLVDLLQKTDFFRLLSFKRKENRESMKMELVRLIIDETQWVQLAPRRAAASGPDRPAGRPGCTRSLRRARRQNRFTAAMLGVLGDHGGFRALLREFAPPLGLFRREDRTPVLGIISRLVGNDTGGARPLIVLDLSAPAGVAWLDDDGVRARIMSVVVFPLPRVADDAWQANNGRVNCSVVFDEPHRFASDKIKTLRSGRCRSRSPATSGKPASSVSAGPSSSSR